MTNEVKFSVVIPVYNKLPHLERSIQSVLNQSYQNFEILLVDDASTDGSSEKLLEFKDERIKHLKRTAPGPGGYAARNLGIANATSEWICFLDADDEWEPQVLETVRGVIQSNGDTEIVCWGWYRTTGETKAVDSYSRKYSDDVLKSFTLTEFFRGPQTMWMGAICLRKDLIVRAGTFPEQGFKRGGDFDTWIRCVWNSRKSLRICKPMTYYYLDSVNMVTKNIDRTTAFLFTPHLLKILDTTKDEELKTAILRFQNSYLYMMLNGYVFKGESIQYNLVSKMNLSKQSLWFVAKLHLNRARFFVLGAPNK